MNNTETTSYYKQINNVRYDRNLLALAYKLVSDNHHLHLDEDCMVKLWTTANDGGKVTDCETRTIQYIMKHFECTEQGKDVMFNKLFHIED